MKIRKSVSIKISPNTKSPGRNAGLHRTEEGFKENAVVNPIERQLHDGNPSASQGTSFPGKDASIRVWKNGDDPFSMFYRQY